MMRFLLVACALLSLGAAPPPAPGTVVKPSKHTSVYNLAYVGAILDICAAGADAAKFREIADLQARLTALVGAIGGHYRDRELPAIYDATRKEMVGSEKLKRHVHEAHGDCAERSMGELRTYVADNEAMIRAAIESAGRKAAPKPQSPAK